MDKATLRKRMRAGRARRSAAERDAGGAAVAARVMALPEVRAARRVLCYVSVRYEVPTHGILEALGDRAAVPHVVSGERMEARAWGPTTLGRYGIPTTSGPVCDDVDVCLCPGLAFDPTGMRLGKGAGYYDRWLADHPGVLPIGLCFDDEVLPRVPHEDHDRALAVLVTPERTLHTGIPVVAGAWIRDGTVLAARRGPDQPRAGLWELPGGKVEAGESPTAALIRELEEELSVRVQVHEPLDEASHVYADLAIHLSLWRVSSDAVPHPTEHVDLRWLDRASLHSVDWAPADLPLLPAVEACLRSIEC